eukprot:2374976-Karenia_brevis.AAC.1
MLPPDGADIFKAIEGLDHTAPVAVKSSGKVLRPHTSDPSNPTKPNPKKTKTDAETDETTAAAASSSSGPSGSVPDDASA